MCVYSIYDDNVAEAIFLYTELFYEEYNGYCVEHAFDERLSPIEWVAQYRLDDFNNFTESKFDFIVTI